MVFLHMNPPKIMDYIYIYIYNMTVLQEQEKANSRENRRIDCVDENDPVATTIDSSNILFVKTLKHIVFYALLFSIG